MKTILVVDDDLGCRESLRMILKPDYHVISAGSPDEAAPILAEGGIDLVMLDIMTPGKNGIVFLKEIAAENPKLRVIMISAYTSPKLVFQAFRLGALDYLAKPFDVREVRFVVEQALLGISRQRVIPEPEIDESLPDTLPPGLSLDPPMPPGPAA
ncbi:MAG: response regulator [Verrucomicrobiae bacterium]|nr:response regulator [Verrucomicrobiae bacterium]